MKNSTYSVFSRSVSTVKEVRGEDAFGLSPQELRPGRSTAPGSRTQPVGPEQSDADAKLAELALDSHVPPARVLAGAGRIRGARGRKSTRLNSSHVKIS